MSGHALFPVLTGRLTAALIEKRQFEPRPDPPSHGNLFAPASGDEDMSGGFRPLWWDPLERLLLLAAGIAVLYGSLRKRIRRRTGA